MDITPFDTDDFTAIEIIAGTILILVGYGIQAVESFVPEWVPVEEIVLLSFPWLWLL